jgi:hypothetical protein
MKLLYMQFYPASYDFCIRFKCPTQHLVFVLPQTYVLPNYERLSFMPIFNNIIVCVIICIKTFMRA